MSDLCAGLGAGAPNRHAATFWKLAAAFFEALASGRLASDVYSKRVASRVLAQFGMLERGESAVSERLAQDLLFFCAQCRDGDTPRTPRLAAVRAAYGLQGQVPVDYEVSHLGRFDPALLTQARKRVAGAKESWSAVAGGEMHRLQGLPEQFSLVGDSLRRIDPAGEALARALMQSAQQVAASGSGPAPALAMEVATSVLYLEAVLEDVDLDDPRQAERSARLAERIEAVRQGQPAQPLESWMEDLYRRVSDRQTLGSVVQELRASLTESEKLIDQFFRHPDDRSVLVPVPGQLTAMRGVLSVLGMEQASHAVLRMRETVDELIATEVDPVRAAQAGTFDRLAANLGALGFLIDMLSYQPQMAKSLFTYDAERDELRPVMGRAEGEGPVIGGATDPGLISQAQSLAQSVVREDVPLEDVSAELHKLSQQAVVADQPALGATLAQARSAVEQAAAGSGDALAAREQAAQAMADFVATASDAAELAPPPAPVEPAATAAGDDDEMREVFLEEAGEVMTDAGAALDALVRSPDDIEQLTIVRRAFHTLKGSSRMVGLNDFGEAAWACEQLYNTWLADQRPADDALRGVTGEALDYLAAWVGEIAAGAAPAYASAPVRAMADALRLHGQRAPLAGAAPAPLPPAVADEPPVPVPDLVLDLRALEGLDTVAEDARDGGPAGTAPSDLPDLPSFELDLSVFEGGAAPVPTQGATLEAFGADPAAAVAPVPDEGGVDDDAGAGELPAITAFDELSEQPTGPGALDAVPSAPALPDLPFFDLDLDLPAAPDDDAPPQAAAPAADDEAGPDAAAPADDGAPFVEALLPSPDAVAPGAPFGEALADDAPLAAEDGLEVVELAFEPEPGSASAEEAEALAGQALPDEPAQPQAPAGAAGVDASEPAAADEPAGDQVKVVGPLHIGIPLFNIYLAEADELSRRLSTEVAEWALELHRPVGEPAVALAHSLAGSSATVGFADLSQLARQFEHALMRSQALGRGSADEATLFGDVAEEIRRLLHQFAAGFPKQPAPELLARLAAHERASAHALQALRARLDSADGVPSGPGALSMGEVGEAFAESSQDGAWEDEPAEPAEPAVPDLLDAVPASAEPAEPPRPWFQPAAAPVAPPAPAPVQDEPLSLAGFLSTASVAPTLKSLPERLQGEALHVTGDAGPDLGVDDDIDAVDAVDAELFPIFEEEALELLPQLSAQMRAWQADPGDAQGANACMRTLHTFKGGARLAGAMRLGELAHRLETAIERLLAGGGQVPAGDLEPLQARVDVLMAVFEALRHQDAQAYADAEAAVGQDPEGPAATPGALAPFAAPEAPADAEAQAQADPAWPEPAAGEAPQTADAGAAPVVDDGVDWSRFLAGPRPAVVPARSGATLAQGAVRVRSQLLDRMVNQAGEVSITRARLASEVAQIKGSMHDLGDNLERLRQQLRDIELQAETQMSSHMEAAKAEGQSFDPLEFDRFTRFQEITRMMAESVNDVATVQRSLQRTLDTTEDELAAQARLTRDLQDDLLRTRMVEFEGLSERLYRVVRLAAKDTGKQVRLDIVGGAIEVDRGVLDRMVGAFEHLLRNGVSHGIEPPAEREAAGKDPVGTIVVALQQEGNEVAVEFRDDGAGLDLARIRARAVAAGLIEADGGATDAELAQLIFAPGFTTSEVVTELSGRGVGMDVVRADVQALGGHIETATTPGQGTSFRLVLPLTTAVTQIVMLRCAQVTVGVPAHLVEIVRRVRADELAEAYRSGSQAVGGQVLPFFWMGALLQSSGRGEETARSHPVLIVRSAQQRVALHVDEVLGTQEVVVKNLGPQLSRLPGLSGMTLLASGAVALIYNPVALATVYGDVARALTQQALQAPQPAADGAATGRVAEPVEDTPLVLVVDDSLTVRRVTQRLLAREGYRVALARDGLEALERLAEARPAVVLSDIEMPRMDGFDLVRNIRGDARLAGLPVIMITSRIAQKHRDYAAELGVNHYLGKPYGEDELLALIARYATAGEAAGAL